MSIKTSEVVNGQFFYLGRLAIFKEPEKVIPDYESTFSSRQNENCFDGEKSTDATTRLSKAPADQIADFIPFRDER